MSTKAPTEEVRIGAIKAAIWQNQVKDGGVRYNVTFGRLYRTDDGEWKTTTSFGRNDLLVLAKLADLAHTRIFALQAAEDHTETATDDDA